ncbi:beta-phosphoglucomutase [Petrotoga sp. 9PWA.NaAc.5.4]|uniref:beta-phosphoglucomutase n=1 Tax=Petrotoga sp. 9PWA.NaAc.5.4 TaxID=1434328 RepID=UPI000CB56DF6|nr:beta-phosphoglucomutase [Petrotoga sp. 9PWA.NaAc.5.4]PNR94331.1 beta-phosphoglucomutase [Petrotoga sp. 9PWA.NaAc.5.4]
MIKACIFDLDGVIVDTAKYHFLAWKKLADELNIKFTEKDNERLKGVSRLESLEIVLKLGNLQLIQDEKIKLAEKKNDYYIEYISALTEDDILPGVRDFIEKLRINNIKMAIASASKNTKIILKKLKLEQKFDVIIDGTMIINAKPDPEIFLKAAEELKVRPEECVVFEDAIAGIQAAKKAKMKVIGVGSAQILQDADKVIRNFEGLDISVFKDL